MGLPSDLTELFRLLRDKGALATAKEVWASVRLRVHLRQERRFDREHGVDTGGFVKLSEFTIASENRNLGLEYAPTPVPLCRWLLRRLPDVSDFVFVDFGSGKGRMLFIASEYAFRRIIGLDFAVELHETALRNIKNFRSPKQRCMAIEALCMDAAEFPIPEERCVFYFYVPFRPPLMNRVLDHIGASYHASPRKMYILFAKPWFGVRGILDDRPWLRRIETPRPWWMNMTHDPMDVLMYETRSEDEDKQS